MRSMAVLVLAVFVSAACRGAQDFDRGRRAARAGEWDAAVRYYQRALGDEPDNVEYRAALQRARLEAGRAHREEAKQRAAAGDVRAAITELELALEYDPTNRYAREELEELRTRLRTRPVPPPTSRVSPLFPSEPLLDPASPEPIQLKFAEGTSLRTVLTTLGKLAGINVLFDESYRDKRVAVELDGVTFLEALELLLQTNGLFYKAMSSSSVVVTEEK